MEKVVESLTYVPQSLTSKRDDDLFDRMSSHYTTFLLTVFAVVVTVQTYVGSVITCWVPKHVTKHQTEYVNSYCWVKNTYYVPLEERLPQPDEPHEHVLLYYQWVPFILVGQAVLFYLPSVFWHGLNQQGGVDCDNILAAAHKLELHDDKKKKDETEQTRQDKLLKLITNQMHRFLIHRVQLQRRGVRCSVKNLMNAICRPCGRRFGSYLVLLFLVSKLLYLVNIIGQLFVLNSFLTMNYNLYGFELFRYLSSEDDWTESPGVAFPRVTFCDSGIRRVGNLHRYTVQCALPINMFTEKIYMFLWFWMVFVAIITILGFFVWLMRAISHSDKVTFVMNHLRKMDDLDKDSVQDFVSNYLAQDGAFILRLIAHNTNSIIVTEITCSLFKNYKKTLALRETSIPKEATEALDSTLVKPALNHVSTSAPVP